MVAKKQNSDESLLRNKIFKVLNNSKVPVWKVLKVVSQCESHIRNRIIVENIARECGLKLSGFFTNESLEIYYDIKRGRSDMGYISKGWEDPGFRIGNLIMVEKWKSDSFKKHAYEILRFCAVNGIVMTVEETQDALEIHLDGVIYSEGFNKDTFLKTLETLDECVAKVEELIG